MTCLFGRIQVELNSGSSISDLYVAWGPDVKYPRSLALCKRRTLDLSVKIHVKKCVLYTRNYGTILPAIQSLLLLGSLPCTLSLHSLFLCFLSAILSLHSLILGFLPASLF